MHHLKIKVCGMRDPGNIRDVMSLAPDFMGFIFYKGTPRFVGEDFSLPQGLSPLTSKVGVFVNESTDNILATVERYGLDYVQLHGGESAAQCRDIKSNAIGVIKVFSVDDNTNFDETNEFADVVDYFLFDTKGKYYGGNAKRFDWSVLARYHGEIPFFLSGGIGSEHIGELDGIVKGTLLAIDVNSGVEVRPGYKDIAKIKAIQTILKSKQ